MMELRNATREETREERAPEVNDEDRRQRILRQKMRMHPRQVLKRSGQEKEKKEKRDAAAG